MRGTGSQLERVEGVWRPGYTVLGASLVVRLVEIADWVDWLAGLARSTLLE